MSLVLALGCLVSIADCQARYTSSFQALPKAPRSQDSAEELSAPPKAAEGSVFRELPPEAPKQQLGPSDDFPPLPPQPPLSPLVTLPIAADPRGSQNDSVKKFQPLPAAGAGVPDGTVPLRTLPASPDEAFFTQPERSPSPTEGPAFDSFRVRHDSAGLTSPKTGLTDTQNVTLIHFEAPSEARSEGTAEPVLSPTAEPPPFPVAARGAQPAAEPAASFTPSRWTSAELMDRYSLAEVTAQGWGTPVRLVDMLRVSPSSGRKAEMVNQYWETWMRWGRMQNCQRYEEWLAQIDKAANPSEQLLLDSARNLADSQTAAARIDFKRAQIRLREYINSRAGTDSSDYQKLPLPADLPLVQKYNTNFDLYRQQGRVPSRLLHIDAVLSDTIDLIDQQTEGVNLTQTTTEQLITAFRQGQLSLANLLEAGRTWKTAEENLITSVANYNRMIADYSLTVANLNHSPEILTAMLIGAPRNRSDQPAAEGLSGKATPANPQPPQSRLSYPDRPSTSPGLGGEAGSSKEVLAISDLDPARPANPTTKSPAGDASTDWSTKPSSSNRGSGNPLGSSLPASSPPKSESLPPWGPRAENPTPRGETDFAEPVFNPPLANPSDTKPIDSKDGMFEQRGSGQAENPTKSLEELPSKNEARPLTTESEAPFRPIFPPDQEL